ncbi:MAG: FAD-dependent oxidoreductase [Proteobacteria bacterium]|nr:FAD-dependent oxidoreductase [Pseudomonadota bacterium]
METASPDLCIIGTDPAGFGVAFAAGGLGVPVCFVTGGPPLPALVTALARLSALGIRVVEAPARFTDRRTVIAGDLTIRARRFVIATGVRPAPLPFAGAEEIPQLRPGESPAGLLVLGARARGVAQAQRAARQGVPTLLVVPPEGFLPGFDHESAALLRTILETDGVRIVEGIDPATITIGKAGALFDARFPGGTHLGFSHLVCDLGEVPNLEALDPGAAGLKTAQGRLVLSSSLRSDNARIYAAGTVTGRPHAARHAALHARILLSEILFRRTARIGPLDEIRQVESEPALVEFGMREADFAPRDISRHSLLRVPVAGARIGLLKAVTDKAGGLRGVSLLSPRAAETGAVLALAARNGNSVESLAEVPVASPGEGEAIGALARLAIGAKMRAPSVRRLIRFLRIFG